MKWLGKNACGILLACLLSGQASAQFDWKAPLDIQRAVLQKAVQEQKVPDLQVAFFSGGRLVWSEVLHGQSDGKATTETPFRIASVSKCITATALLRLVEQGKIGLNRPIDDYGLFGIPHEEKMTVSMLAGHLAGIRHYQGLEALNAQHYADLASGLDIFKTSPLVSVPGTEFHYSSYGYNLLGVVMEKAAKQPFPALVEDLVLKPLKMNHTRIDDLTQKPAPVPTPAPTYARDKQGVTAPVTPSDDSYKWPSGGYLSTAEDLVLLGNAYLKPGLLTAESIKLAETSQITPSGKVTGYSLGWSVRTTPRGDVILFHTGEAIGGESLLVISPSKGSVFAAVWNVSQAGMLPIVNQVGGTLFQNAR